MSSPRTATKAKSQMKVDYKVDKDEARVLDQLSQETRSMEMENVLEAKGADHGVIELYSRPRIVPLAKRYGLTVGYSLDLTMRGPDGQFWISPS